MAQTAGKAAAATTDSHVVVFAFPFGTHAGPLLAIIHRMATFSPTTHFSFFNTEKSNNSIFPMYAQNTSSNIKAYNVWDGLPEDGTVVRPPNDMVLFMNSASESFKKGMETAVTESGRRVSCLVTDAFFWFAAEMAAEMGVPWMPFWTGGPNSLSAHVYTDFLRETTGVERVADRQDEYLNFIPGMSKIQIRDLPQGVLLGNLESPFYVILQKMGATLSRANAVFINSFEELDLAITNDLKSKFNTYLNVGPFHLISSPPTLEDKHGCISWLDKQNPASVAYIGFGSSPATTPPVHELVALAEALEDTKTPFVWSIGEKSQAHLPNGFVERTKMYGIVVPWTPQLHVLAHRAVGVFLTHCGWNSMLESIAGGVPMICRPFYGDQGLNGKTVEKAWEIGVVIEGGVFTKSGVMVAFDEVLLGEKGKKMRENVGVLKELAKKAVAPSGSSSNNLIALSNLVVNAKKR